MFYCEDCGEKSNWPDSIFKSWGRCEICDTVGACNDVPSRYLPIVRPKRVAPKLDTDSIT